MQFVMVVDRWSRKARGQQEALTGATRAKREQRPRRVVHNGLTHSVLQLKGRRSRSLVSFLRMIFKLA